MDHIAKLQAFLPDSFTAALITSEINCRYLTGFPFTDGAVLVTKDEVLLLTDFRYIEAAGKRAREGVTVVKFSKLLDTINDIILQKNIKDILLEEDHVSLSLFERLREKLNAELITDIGLSKKLSEIRIIKTPEEIRLIEKAQRIAERAYLEVLNYVKPGAEERAIAVELEHLMKRYGAERVAFDLITICGANTSLPHGVPGSNIVKEGDFFTFDIGAVYEGYHSDMTRTVAVGSVSDEMQRVYDIVYEAHRLAAEKIVAGNTTADVDVAAREYIEQNGYGDCFGHSTGHGVGLEIHESPRVYKTDDTILVTGMVITDEPGVYLPGRFGVRIEDMYVVEGDHARSLASIPKELEII